MPIYKARLPHEYQEVEYIEATGTQYIDTNFIANQDTKIVLDLQPTQSQSTKGLYGSIDANNEHRFEVFIDSNGNIEWGYGSNYYFGHSSFGTSRLKLEQNKNDCYINGVIETALSLETFTCVSSFYLFNMNRPSMLNGALIKLYSCKLYDNGTLVRDFIPVYRKSDMEIGLYDLVNGVFYTNQGSGTFLKGNDVLPKVSHLFKGSTEIVKRYKGTSLIYAALPVAYQRVEYLESHGTEYIDSGLLAKNTLGFNVDVAVKTDNEQVWFGRQFCLQLGSNGGTDNTGVYYGWNGVNTQSGNRPHVDYGAKHNYKHNFNNSKKALLDDVENQYYVLDYANFADSTAYSIIIFARREETGDILYPSNLKMYSFKITDGQTLIRNFVPCYRKSDNVAGLYDTVNQVFYTNQGSGTFAVGPNV